MAARVRQGAGRMGGLSEARELVSLVSALGEGGDTLTARTIAARMGVSEERAAKYLLLLLMAGDEDAPYLSLSADDDLSQLTLAFSGGMSGREVRLTRSETLAVAAALNRVGIPQDHPLRQAVMGPLSSESVLEEDLRRVLAPLTRGEEPLALAACAEALVGGRCIAFSYQGSLDATPQHRLATPLSLEQRHGSWYLEAFDKDRHGARTFRLDRMTDAHDAGPAPEGRTAKAPREKPRTVGMEFHDPRYLELLSWPGLVVSERDEGVVRGTIPYYDGMWLPRRIAACAGTATCDDAKVMRLARDYASRLLANA